MGELVAVQWQSNYGVVRAFPEGYDPNDGMRGDTVRWRKTGKVVEPQIEWWKFWSPRSGAIGGAIVGTLVIGPSIFVVFYLVFLR